MRITDLRQIMQQPRVRTALKSVLASVLGLIVLSFFGVPPLLRWGVETQGSKALGRQMIVEGVSFNPLTLSASIKGLRIAEADGKGDFLSVALLRANLSLASIWHRGAVLDVLRIEQPVLHVARLDESRFDFSDILDRFASPKDAPPSEPARFSLNNIELIDGSIVFDDKPVGRIHKIEHLHIGVPFVSSLPARVESFVLPHLEAKINGADFRLQGQVKPFADHREAMLDLSLDDVDVTQYLAYVPVKLPVKVLSANFASDLHLVWVEASAQAPASFAVKGKLGLKALKVNDLAGEPLFGLDTLALDVERIEPLANPVLAQLNSLRLDAPWVNLKRMANGKLNVQPPESEAKPAQSPTPAVVTKTPLISLGKLSLNKGRVQLVDESVPGVYHQTLDSVEMTLDKFDLAGATPASLQLKAHGERGLFLNLQARLDMKEGRHSGHLAVDGANLDALRPYYAAALDRAYLTGLGTLVTDFKLAPGERGPEVRLDALSLRLKDFSLGEGGSKPSLVRVPETQLDGVSVDMAKREVVVSHFASKDAQISTLRDKQGEFQLVRLLQAHSTQNVRAKEALRADLKGAAQAVVEAAPSTKADAPWRLSVGDAGLSNWHFHLDDLSGSAPVALDLADIAVSVKNWSNQHGNQAQAELNTRVNKTGKVAIGGHFGTEPLKGALHLDLRAVDFLPVQPYVDDLYRILITRGNLSVKGDLAFDLSQVDKPDIRFAGGVSVNDFNSLDRLNNTDFMRWKRFSFDDMKVQTQPISFATREVRLEDFYTRLILDAQGRLNVRELAAKDDAPGLAPTGNASAPVAVANQATTAAKPAAALPQVRVGKIVLSGGNVNYTDQFIKPNYDANLRALNGSLSGLSSDQNSVAALALTASVDGSAPVNIAGELNPFRQDSYLDIQAQVRDVDLTGISTYSAKFVGYGIDKGKLSMAVQYKIRDRKLEAKNRITLDQLTFGEKIESPEATKLPVLFAVSLLKDRHGVIDVNLPISGSLDDPQFSVGGVLLRVIGNLISKAITAPFALIGSVFGDGEELAWLDFAFGSAVIPAQGGDKLQALSKALLDRPALKLEIAGRADPAADVVGLKRMRLDGKLRALKAAQLVKRGEAVGAVDELKLDEAEYPVLLKNVYESEKIDGRPRNALGLIKSLPVEDMEKIIFASYVVSPEDLQALAGLRAQAVRARLLEQSQVAPERIFLLGTANATEAHDGKPASARVEFSLK